MNDQRAVVFSGHFGHIDDPLGAATHNGGYNAMAIAFLDDLVHLALDLALGRGAARHIGTGRVDGGNVKALMAVAGKGLAA